MIADFLENSHVKILYSWKNQSAITISLILLLLLHIDDALVSKANS